MKTKTAIYTFKGEFDYQNKIAVAEFEVYRRFDPTTLKISDTGPTPPEWGAWDALNQFISKNGFVRRSKENKTFFPIKSLTICHLVKCEWADTQL